MQKYFNVVVRETSERIVSLKADSIGRAMKIIVLADNETWTAGGYSLEITPEELQRLEEGEEPDDLENYESRRREI